MPYSEGWLVRVFSQMIEFYVVPLEEEDGRGATGVNGSRKAASGTDCLRDHRIRSVCVMFSSYKK